MGLKTHSWTKISTVLPNVTPISKAYSREQCGENAYIKPWKPSSMYPACSIFLSEQQWQQLELHRKTCEGNQVSLQSWSTPRTTASAATKLKERLSLIKSSTGVSAQAQGELLLPITALDTNCCLLLLHQMKGNVRKIILKLNLWKHKEYNQGSLLPELRGE